MPVLTPRSAAVALLVLFTAPGTAIAQSAPACPAQLPIQLFDYDAAAPLHVRDSLLAVEDGVEVRAFSFDSPMGGRASGILARPVAAGRHPAIVNLTGSPARPATARASTVALARTGAVVALLWAPSVRPHGMGTASPVTLTPADSAHQVQFVVDVRRTVDMLVARDDVDPSRLAIVGISFGGTVAAHAAGVEPRFRAAALVVADMGMVTHLTGPGARGLPDDVTAEEREAWLRAMAPVEAGCWVGRSRAALLLQNGETDRLVPVAQARLLHERVPASADIRWYPAGHGLDARAAEERLAWLAAQIGIVPPAGAGR